MATTTNNQSLRVPQSTDDPNIVEDMTNLALDIEKKLVMVFNSVTDRSARLPSPQEGMLSYLKDNNTYEYYDGAAWTEMVSSGAPTFTSGTAVPSNAVGADGDVFWKI